MNKSIKWFVARLREPSTWAGFAVLLQAFGVPSMLVPVLGIGLDWVAAALPVAAAGAAVILSEKPSQPMDENDHRS